VKADPGGWMQTRAGLAYFHENPTLASIRIADIAHALSMICRFGGHTSRFYSVAEHSVLVSQVVPTEHAFVALMHDATEAYVCDVPRPLKRMLGKVYSDLEDKAWDAICIKFGMDYELPPCVKDADNAVLLAEKAALLLEPPLPWSWAEGLVAADVKIRALRPNQAKDMFLRRFTELMP
jgi:5'-deoxynucleotidase YfbR-like HD superfamily hydrolase